MWKKVLVVLAVVVAGFAAYVATRPAEYRVQRSATVAAPPGAVYALVSDLQKFQAWSPWSKLDPAMKFELGGTPGAVGHTYHWTGNDKVGEGRMTITEAVAGSQVAYRLEFLKPFESVARTEFTVAPEGAGTRVTWSMAGHNDLMGKLYATFVDLDAAIGKDFENGLGQLNAMATAAR